ncbi:MAG TPA: SDR family NAD(P)-dependent oxidoreductase [Candidatus Dormibacteraeota bacterium]|nr:SDR family NAD(P)-dependent oxidoreductase [Candidatus Dormibacteraeota bacterium]
MDPQGAVAIVTGGASGLGAATAARLAVQGATVVILDLPSSQGEQTAAGLPGSADHAFAPADVQDPAAVQQAVDAAAARGPLRILVNCAGIGTPGKVVGRDGSPMPLEQFARVVGVNLVGTFNVIRLAAAAMVGNQPTAAGERGVIVNTASIAAFDGQIGQVSYSASKGGIAGMTLPLARDLSAAGVRVCTIAPGIFDTPLMNAAPQNVKDVLAAGVPNPSRFGRPDEYAALVLHIVENEYLNGEVIRLDGALRMPPR